MSELTDAGGGRIAGLPDSPEAPGVWEPAADLAYGEKIQVLRQHAQAYGLRTMVETGLYNGNGSGMQMLDLIDNYTAIDVNREQVEAAREKGYDVWHGDSAVLLHRILQGGAAGIGRGLNGPVLFWLDAHLVAEAGEINSSSIMGELDAILAWPHARESVVLIDDLRMMGREGWPTVEHVRVRVGNTWVREERDDIMRLLPRNFSTQANPFGTAEHLRRLQEPTHNSSLTLWANVVEWGYENDHQTPAVPKAGERGDVRPPARDRAGRMHHNGTRTPGGLACLQRLLHPPRLPARGLPGMRRSCR